jgi:hypothetical protein
MMVSSVVTVDWQETRKCPVGAFSMLPGRGLCQVLAADGVDRIVGYRAFFGDSPWAVSERVAVRRLRELQPWRDLKGARVCAKLLNSKTISTPTSLRYINDTR